MQAVIPVFLGHHPCLLIHPVLGSSWEGREMGEGVWQGGTEPFNSSWAAQHSQETAANHSLALQLFSSYQIRLLKEKKNPNLAAPGAGSCLAVTALGGCHIPLTQSKGWQLWAEALLALGMGVSEDLGSQEGQHHPSFSFQTVTQWVQRGVWEDCGPFSVLGKGKRLPVSRLESFPLTLPQIQGKSWLRLLPTSQPHSDGWQSHEIKVGHPWGLHKGQSPVLGTVPGGCGCSFQPLGSCCGCWMCLGGAKGCWFCSRHTLGLPR